MSERIEIAVRRQVTIVNEKGLHARAAAKFVKLAGTFEAEITVGKNGTEVSGLSIMGLMMLAAAPGCCLDLTAKGPGANQALSALVNLIANRFHEKN